MYDHLIFCIYCSNNVPNNAFGRQYAVAEEMFDKNWIPTELSKKKKKKKKKKTHKIVIYFWLGGGGGGGGSR